MEIFSREKSRSSTHIFCSAEWRHYHRHHLSLLPFPFPSLSYTLSCLSLSFPISPFSFSPFFSLSVYFFYFLYIYLSTYFVILSHILSYLHSIFYSLYTLLFSIPLFSLSHFFNLVVNFINIKRSNFMYESLFLVTFWLWTNFRTKIARVKHWWNWHLVSLLFFPLFVHQSVITL